MEMDRELRGLLDQIENEAVRIRITKILERKGKVSPEHVIEEIMKLIDELNEAARHRGDPPELPPAEADIPIPSVVYGPQPSVVMYGPQDPGFGTGDRLDGGGWYQTRTGDGTSFDWTSGDSESSVMVKLLSNLQNVDLETNQ